MRNDTALHFTFPNPVGYLPVELEDKSMKYIKSCLLITMLLGVGYATCEAALGDVNGDINYNILDIVGLANCVLAQNFNGLNP